MKNRLRNLVIVGTIALSPLQEATAQDLFASLKTSTSEPWMLAWGMWTANPAITGVVGLKDGNQEYSLSKMFDVVDRDVSSGNHLVIQWASTVPTNIKWLNITSVVGMRLFDTETDKNQIFIQWGLTYLLTKKVKWELMWAYVSLPKGNDIGVIRGWVGVNLPENRKISLTIWEILSNNQITTRANLQIWTLFQLSDKTSLEPRIFIHSTDINIQSLPDNTYAWVSATIKF